MQWTSFDNVRIRIRLWQLLYFSSALKLIFYILQRTQCALSINRFKAWLSYSCTSRSIELLIFWNESIAQSWRPILFTLRFQCLSLTQSSFGYLGDNLVLSERLRWLGPPRYEVAGAITLIRGKKYKGRFLFPLSHALCIVVNVMYPMRGNSIQAGRLET